MFFKAQTLFFLKAKKKKVCFWWCDESLARVRFDSLQKSKMTESEYQPTYQYIAAVHNKGDPDAFDDDLKSNFKKELKTLVETLPDLSTSKLCENTALIISNITKTIKDATKRKKKVKFNGQWEKWYAVLQNENVRNHYLMCYLVYKKADKASAREKMELKTSVLINENFMLTPLDKKIGKPGMHRNFFF